MLRISQHSKHRIIERNSNINFMREAKKNALQAYRSGKVIGDFQKYPKFFSYLQNKHNQTRTCAIRIYHNNIYIWRGKSKTLVTAHPIPNRYIKEMQKSEGYNGSC